jgi:hypothetical protein
MLASNGEIGDPREALSKRAISCTPDRLGARDKAARLA